MVITNETMNETTNETTNETARSVLSAFCTRGLRRRNLRGEDLEISKLMSRTLRRETHQSI